MITGDVAQDPLDLGQEPHVCHSVGLVENHNSYVDEIDLFAIDQVDHSPGCGCHHLDAILELSDLTLDVGTAVHGCHRDISRLADRTQLIFDLGGQLSGWYQDQCPWPPSLGLLDSLENRQPEGERLARPGLGLATDVPASKRIGDGQFLDGEGGGDSSGR